MTRGGKCKNNQVPKATASTSISDTNILNDLSNLSYERLIQIITTQIKETLKTENDFKDKKIEELENEINILKGKIESLTDRTNGQEEKTEFVLQDRLKHTMILSGDEVPQCAPEEDCAAVVLQTLEEKLNVTILPDDIRHVTRLGKPKQAGEVDKRPFKFLLNPEKRTVIITACRVVRPRLYLNEFLTPYKRSLLTRIKRIKIEVPGAIDKYYVNDGVMTIRKSETNHKIRTHHDIDKYMNELQLDPVRHQNE